MSDRSRRLVLGGSTVGVLVSGVLVWQSSHAAFSETTVNPNNTFAAGTVALTDDRQPASKLFDVTGLVGGDSDQACIQVSYHGSLASDVRMYVKPGDLTSTAAGSLAPYLTLQVDEGTGTDPECADFVSGEVAYNAAGAADPAQTLDAFAGSVQGFATGVGSFSPTGANQSRTYRVSYWVQGDNDAQGKDVSLRLTWEARNR